ncbi:MAG TPA: hypothetical protein VG843_12790 [Rhizomicrobium sp.]|nr:hypothetical protein [Rhizomicrobium sp.]
MATTYTERTGVTAATTGSIADAAGGIAVIVLSIIGLGRATPGPLMSIAVIVLGAAFLAEGGAVIGEYTQLLNRTVGAVADSGAGMMMELMIGAAILVLGILGLIGVAPAILAPVAVIVAGALLLVSAPVMMQLVEIRRVLEGTAEPAQSLLRASASGVSGMQILAGLAAIVLGILDLTGATIGAGALTLVALLILGAALTFNGTALTGSVYKIFSR